MTARTMYVVYMNCHHSITQLAYLAQTRTVIQLPVSLLQRDLRYSHASMYRKGASVHLTASAQAVR